jgi:hypothetical protein
VSCGYGLLPGFESLSLVLRIQILTHIDSAAIETKTEVYGSLFFVPKFTEIENADACFNKYLKAETIAKLPGKS